MTIDYMIQGGLFYAVVAIESANDRIQKVIKKYLDLHKLYMNTEYLGKQGIILGSFNIIGLPTERKKDVMNTIRYNCELSGITKTAFFILNPHPGTEIYKLVLEQGYVSQSDSTNGYMSSGLQSTTKYISTEELLKLQKLAYESFIQILIE